MSEIYNVIFRGGILSGHELPDVKTRMAQLFKLDDAKLAAIFSGKPVALKKNCDKATADKFKAVLTKAGADIEVRIAAPVVVPATPAPVRESPVVEAKLAEIKPEEVRAEKTGRANKEGELSLASKGELVLTNAEREATHTEDLSLNDIDTSHLELESAKKITGKAVFGVVEEESISEVTSSSKAEAKISAPDFGLLETGSDMLDEADKLVVEPVSVDISGIDVAEVGADVLREEERAPVIESDIPDLQTDLAPVGTDVGQIPKEPAPPAPSTDHLSLE